MAYSYSKDFLKVVSLILLLAAGLIEAKCGKKTDCGSCTRETEFGIHCRWCETTQSCHEYSVEPECESSQLVSEPYDCPIPVPDGFEYDPVHAHDKMLPLAAAAHAFDPQMCLSNAFGNATLRRNLIVPCDVAKDTCAGYTAVSHSDRAIFVGFRGTTTTWQLVLEGADSIFVMKKSFEAGGKVDDYFYKAFYAVWNAGMKDDLLALRSQFPDYELWVSGHSLGGAMASLCASLAIKLDLWTGEKVKLVTFGQPRTGDLAYANSHDAMFSYSYRLVHHRDMVPQIPPKVMDNWFDSFFHHRYEIWYNNDMTDANDYKFCARPDDNSCSAGQIDLSVADHTHYFNVDISDFGDGGCVDSKQELDPSKNLEKWSLKKPSKLNN